MKKKIKFAKNDYSPLFLPQKRSEVLKDCYKVRFSLIVKCGLTLLLFALPFIISIVLMDFSRFGTVDYENEQLQAFYFYWNIILRACVIPSLFVLLVGVSGVSRIIKLLVWQEGIDYWHDFKLGVKENYKAMVIPSIILCLIYLIYFAIFYCVWESAIIGYVVIAFICLLFVPMYLWHLSLANVYQAKTKSLMTNSMFFFGKSIPWTLLMTVLVIWPLFVEYFQIDFGLVLFVVKPVVWIFMLIFYYPFLMIVATLFAHSKFDKYINSESYPDIYRKGLFNPNDYKEEEIK